MAFGPEGEVLSTTGTAHVTADSDGTSHAGGGAIIMADGALIDAGSGLVDMDASGNITLGSVVTTAEAQITSDCAAIVDGGDTDPELTAGRVVLRAETGIGDSSDPGGALETQTNPAASPLVLAALTQSGDIQLDNTGALTIGTVDGVFGIRIGDPDTADQHDRIAITTASPYLVDADVDNTSGGDIVLAAKGQAVGDDLTIQANITARTNLGIDGNIYLYAGHDIRYQGGLISAENGGDIHLSAGEDYNDGVTLLAGHPEGDVRMASGLRLLSGSGTIQVEAARNIELSILSTSTDILVSADRHKHGAPDGQGEIIDNLLGEDAHLRGTSAYLEAGSGIGQGVDPGTGLPGDNDTQLETIQIVNHGLSGDIHVSETPAGGALGITWLTQSDPAGVGDSWVRTEDGTLTVVAGSTGVDIRGSGDVTLYGMGGDGSHLVINTTVRATSGTINLHADEDIRADDARGHVVTTNGPIVFRPNFDGSTRPGTTDDGSIFFTVETAPGTHVVISPGVGDVLTEDRFGISRGTYRQEYTLPTTRLLDFNGTSGQTAAGYPGVLLPPENLAEDYLGVPVGQTYDATDTNALGWNAAAAAPAALPLASFDRGTSDALLRDGQRLQLGVPAGPAGRGHAYHLHRQHGDRGRLAVFTIRPWPPCRRTPTHMRRPRTKSPRYLHSRYGGSSGKGEAVAGRAFARRCCRAASSAFCSPASMAFTLRSEYRIRRISSGPRVGNSGTRYCKRRISTAASSPRPSCPSAAARHSGDQGKASVRQRRAWASDSS